MALVWFLVLVHLVVATEDVDLVAVEEEVEVVAVDLVAGDVLSWHKPPQEWEQSFPGSNSGYRFAVADFGTQPAAKARRGEAAGDQEDRGRYATGEEPADGRHVSIAS